jgi:uncharacterized membrane protein YfcA
MVIAPELLLLLAIFMVAVLYSSVGHGGASGYLAVLAIAGMSIATIRPSALLLNMIVSGIAFAQFQRAGYFRWKLFWPFAITSIPAAFLCARITVDPFLYKQLLAICLLSAVARLFGLFGKWQNDLRHVNVLAAAFIGLGIGSLSGIIGIGGGIILSPIILLLRWGTAHEAAAVSALFIFVNSAAGLVGINDPSFLLSNDVAVWLVVALSGGMIGSYFGARKAAPKGLRQILGSVLLVASAKLLLS